MIGGGEGRGRGRVSGERALSKWSVSGGREGRREKGREGGSPGSASWWYHSYLRNVCVSLWWL